MPPTPVEVTKSDFQGDILNREFKILRGSTGEYSYDYVDQTPDVVKALASIKYYRLKSKSLADIEAAIKARSKGTAVGPSPTNLGYVSLPENNTPGSGSSGNASPKPGSSGNASPKPGSSGNASPKPGSPKPANEGNGNGNTSRNLRKPLLETEPEVSMFEGMNVKPAAKNSSAAAASTSTYEPPKLKLTTEEEDIEYCYAKETLAKGIPLSNTSQARYKSIVNAYTAKYNKPEDIPDCKPKVSAPPAPTASRSGGKRKTKRSKKSKRKGKSRKH
jgi:hypothetical protein